MRLSRLFALFIVFAFLASAVPVKADASDPWADAYSNWQYRREITISNPNSEDLTDFQVKITLDSTNFDFSKANDDGSDIRFADTQGNPLSYWIEKWDNVNEEAVIWVKVPSIPANGETTIYMYYGNSGAESESDGEAVFEFFDDFDGTELDTGKWTVGGSPSLSFANGIMTINTDAIGEGLQSTLQHQNAVIEARIKWNSGTYGEFGPATAYQDQSHFYGAWPSKWDNTFRIHKKTPSVSTAIVTTSYTPATGRWMTISLIVADASAGHLKAHLEDEDGTVKDLEATDTDLSGGYVGLTTPSAKSESHDVDWFRVRKYAEQEPTATVGSEETNSGGETYTITLTLKDDSGASLTDVDIYLNDAYQGTFDDGDSLTVASPGTYTVKGEKDGYVSAETNVEVVESTTSYTASLTLTEVPAPSISITPDPPHVGDTVTITLSAEAKDGFTVSYKYRLEDGDGNVLVDWTDDDDGTVTYTIPESLAHGTLVVRAKTVYDDGTSQYESLESSLSVDIANSPPTAPADITADKDVLSTTDTVTFTASGSTDVDGDTITYEYKFEDADTSTVLQDWSTTNSLYIDASLYEHTIRVYARATDGTDYSDEYYEDFQVTNSPPSAPTDISIYPAVFRVNVQTSISATGSTDAEGDAITYEFKIVDSTTGTTLMDWSETSTYTITSLTRLHHKITVYARAYDGYVYSGEYSETFFVMPEQTIDQYPFDINSILAMSVHSLSDVPDMTVIREKLALNSEDMALFDTYNLRGGSTIYIYIKVTNSNITLYYTHPLAPFLAPHDTNYDTSEIFADKEVMRLLNFLKDVNALPPSASSTTTVYSSEANCAGGYAHVYYKGGATSGLWAGSFSVNAVVNATSPATLLQYYISIPGNTLSHNTFYLNWYDTVDEDTSTNYEIDFYRTSGGNYFEDTIYGFNVGGFDSFKESNQFGFYLYAYEDTISSMTVRMRLIVVDNTDAASTTAMNHISYEILPLPLQRTVTFNFNDDAGNPLDGVTLVVNNQTLGIFNSGDTYTFDEICTARFVASKEHYIDDVKDVYLATTSAVTFTLDRESYTVYVYAYDENNQTINEFNLTVDGTPMGVFNSGDSLTLKYGTYTFGFNKEGYLSMSTTALVDHDGVEVVFTSGSYVTITFYFYDAETLTELTDVVLSFDNTSQTIDSGDQLWLHKGYYTFAFSKEGYENRTLGVDVLSDITISVYLAPNITTNETALTSLENPTAPEELQGYAPNITSLNEDISGLFTGPVGWALAVLFVLALAISSIKLHQKPAVTAAVVGTSVIYLGTWIKADWGILWVLMAMLLSASVLRIFGRYQK